MAVLGLDPVPDCGVLLTSGDTALGLTAIEVVGAMRFVWRTKLAELFELELLSISREVAVKKCRRTAFAAYSRGAQ